MTPSFAYVLDRCASTVCTVTNRACAISLFVRPSAASAATCCSVCVSSPGVRGRRPPTRASSARAWPAQPGEPSASKSAAARSIASRAPPHWRARRCARPSESRVRAASKRSPSRSYASAASASAGGSSISASHRQALASPQGCSWASASARSRAATARASSRAPSSDERLDQIRSDRKCPGLVDALALRVVPHGSKPLRGERRVVREQRGQPERPRCLERLPAEAARLGLRERRGRPALGLLRQTAPGGEQRAAALVGGHDQQLPVVGGRPLVEQP